MNRYLLFIFCFLNVQQVCYLQQTPDLHNEVKNLFPAGENIWYSYYTGKDINLNRTHLVIGHNQKQNKGIFYSNYLRTKLIIESDYPNFKKSFIVSDTFDNLWGELKYTETDSLLHGQLINRSRQIAFEFNLQQTDRTYYIPSECPHLLKYHSFKNDSLGIQLFIQILPDRKANGYYFNKSEQRNYYLSGQCLDQDCKEFQMTVNQLETGTSNKIKMIFNDNKIIIKENKSNFIIHKTLKKDEIHPYICKTYVSSNHTAFISYPAIPSRSYLRWQQEYTDQWAVNHSGQNQHFIDSTESINLNLDLSIIDNQLISGNYYWSEPGFKRIVNYPFNYNIKSGEPIQLIDLFEKNSDYKSTLLHCIDSCKKIISLNKSESVKKYIANDLFNYWNLLPTGILFYSEFHPVYGRYRIIIPHKRVEHLLRKTNFMKKYL